MTQGVAPSIGRHQEPGVAAARRDRRQVKTFLNRPIDGDWPYLWIDSTSLKVRRGGWIVSVTAIIAIGINTDGRREVLGLEISTCEVEPLLDSACHCRKLR